MLEQQGNALPFIAHYTEDGASKLGLTVTVDIYENAVEIITGASASEIGDGLYWYTLDSGSVDANSLYTAVFHTATSTVDAQNIPALWIVGRTWVNRVDATVSSRSNHSAADVWASATRTLTSFGTLVADVWSYITRTITGGGSSAVDIWGYDYRTLTQSAESIASALSGDKITVKRGDTLSVSLTGLGNISTRTKLYFTVKRKQELSDDDSTVLIEETAGLVRFNASPAPVAGDGSIPVDNETSGNITIELIATRAAEFTLGTYQYDVQMITSTGEVSTLAQGTFAITSDITKAVT